MSIQHNIAGTLTMHSVNIAGSTSSTFVINLNTEIPRQNIVLENVLVEYDTAAHALAKRIIYVDLPFLGAAQLVDGVQHSSRLPILLDNAILTKYKPNLELALQHKIPSKFTMRVFDRDGVLLSDSELKSITLQFQYSKGSTA